MIMRPGQPLLLPANPLFVWFSLAAALLLNMIQHINLWSHAPWAPDVLAVVIVFWCVHQPLRVGVSTAFVLGLLVDVHQGAVLGEHALSYSVLGFLAVTIHRRLLWFPVPMQALQVAPLLAVAHATDFGARMAAGAAFPGWSLILAPVLEAALWPVVTVVLLAPQRRAPDRDENRPL